MKSAHIDFLIDTAASPRQGLCGRLIPGDRRQAIERGTQSIDLLNAASDPADDRNRHAVAEGLVAGSIGSGLPAITDSGVVVGEALQPLAFDRHQAAHADPAGDRRREVVLRDERRRRIARRIVAERRLIAAGVRREGDGAERIRARPRMAAKRSRNERLALGIAPAAAALGSEAMPDGRDQSAGALVLHAATARSARSKGSGRRFPRFAARRKIPVQALLLKKYRSGTAPVSSTSDNEDATPLLGNSEILSVKNSVGEPIPAFAQEPEEGAKIPCAARRQEAGDVLENQPLGPKSSSNAKGEEGQIATRVIKSATLAGDAEALARAPEAEEVNRLNCIPIYLRDIAEIADVGKALGEDGARERLDLCAPAEIPTKERPSRFRRPDAAEQGADPHGAPRSGGEQIVARGTFDNPHSLLPFRQLGVIAAEIVEREHRRLAPVEVSGVLVGLGLKLSAMDAIGERGKAPSGEGQEAHGDGVPVHLATLQPVDDVAADQDSDQEPDAADEAGAGSDKSEFGGELHLRSPGRLTRLVRFVFFAKRLW